MDASEAVARQFLRLHWRLQSVPLLGHVYKRTAAVLQASRNELSYQSWKWLGARPILDLRAVRRFKAEDARLSASIDPVNRQPISGRLVVRVAFHLVRARMRFLAEMLQQLRELPFSEIHIAIDTNSPETRKLLEAAGIDFVNEIAVHEDLDHPFKLTWRHRERLRAVVGQFDYFMYVEDDILVPPEAVRLWHERLPALKQAGFLPGFMRVELNRAGALVSSDFQRPAARSLLRSIENKPYLASPYPYQAFWIYDKETMLAFMDSSIYATGQPGLDLRECMAIGFTYEMTPNGPRSRHLLPLDENAKVDPRCFVFHMPSNYGRVRVPNGAGLGTVPVEGVVEAPSGPREQR